MNSDDTLDLGGNMEAEDVSIVLAASSSPLSPAEILVRLSQLTPFRPHNILITLDTLEKAGYVRSIYDLGTVKYIGTPKLIDAFLLDDVMFKMFDMFDVHIKHPPRFAEYLLHFLPGDHDALIGDLEEEFNEIYQDFGKSKAQFWYYYQVFASFSHLIVAAIKKLIISGIIGWIGGVIRHFIQ